MAGISRESERMSLLVDDLLLLARLDEGRPLVQEPLELEDVVAESVETARALEPGRTIRSDLQEAEVVGDRDRLRQVVDNLLANSVRTPTRTRRWTSRCAATARTSASRLRTAAPA